MKVSFHGTVLDYTSGVTSLEDNAQDLRELVDLLGERFGAPFKEFLLSDDTCTFLVNGMGIMNLGGLDTPLGADDEVEMLPFVDGG